MRKLYESKNKLTVNDCEVLKGMRSASEVIEKYKNDEERCICKGCNSESCKGCTSFYIVRDIFKEKNEKGEEEMARTLYVGFDHPLALNIENGKTGETMSVSTVSISKGDYMATINSTCATANLLCRIFSHNELATLVSLLGKQGKRLSDIVDDNLNVVMRDEETIFKLHSHLYGEVELVVHFFTSVNESEEEEPDRYEIEIYLMYKHENSYEYRIFEVAPIPVFINNEKEFRDEYVRMYEMFLTVCKSVYNMTEERVPETMWNTSMNDVVAFEKYYYLHCPEDYYIYTHI